MIRTAIVGISGYGRWHLMMAIDQMLVGRLKLVGATVINPESEAFVCHRLRELGVPIFATFEEMIATLHGKLDLCLIPTGIHHHAPMTIAALGAGANVLVEKPLAATLQQANAIHAEEARTGRWVAVGFQDLYVEETHVIKRALLDKKIGTVQRITVVGQWPRGHSYYRRNNWAGRLHVDGAWILDSPANNALAHYLNLGLFWAGSAPNESAEIVAAQAGLYRAQAIESFDTFSFRLVARSGIEVIFHGTHSGARNGPPEITIQGSHGKIHWIYDRHYTVTTAAGATQHRLFEFLGARMFVGEAVVKKCTQPDTFVCSTALARAHTRAINLLHGTFPIVDVPAEFLETISEAGETFTRIKGVDTAISTAIERGSLLDASCAPWAVTSAMKDVEDYQVFEGCWPDSETNSPR
ncbi:Gfo/Idh/MocA family protein [Oleiharenicola lentus]|uniref:Gfo/Idh/MocA family protein n=1 Tax=Oleiharenicola lentus TaxID=2508720 RepID=UPI003F6697FB